jgi:hypothetical protein
MHGTTVKIINRLLHPLVSLPIWQLSSNSYLSTGLQYCEENWQKLAKTQKIKMQEKKKNKTVRFSVDDMRERIQLTVSHCIRNYCNAQHVTPDTYQHIWLSLHTLQEKCMVEAQSITWVPYIKRIEEYCSSLQYYLALATKDLCQ